MKLTLMDMLPVEVFCPMCERYIGEVMPDKKDARVDEHLDDECIIADLQRQIQILASRVRDLETWKRIRT